MRSGWTKIDEARFDEMLEVLPPALMTSLGFLLGEPSNHDGDGRPRFTAFAKIAGGFYEGPPLTAEQFRSLKPDDVVLTEAMQRLAPGVYTERDSGPWYVVTPEHDNRLGEDFADRNDARRMVCWLAGEPLPDGWRVERHGDGRLSYDIIIPNRPRACLWARTARARFPARAAEFPEERT